MAVTSVAKIEYTASQDTTAARRREVYQVVFDAIPTDIADALVASAGGVTIPAVGAVYTGSTWIKCKKVGEVQKTDSRLVYLVPVEYDDTLDSSVTTTNPLARPASIDWGFIVIEKVRDKDNAGATIKNTAGDLFDPPIIDQEYRLVCDITRNVSSHSPADAFAKINTVNNATVTIAGVTVTANQALLTDYSAQAMYEGSTEYVQQHFAIEFAPTHDVVVGDMGYYYKDVSDGNKMKEFLDGEGKPSRIPLYLDSAGDNTAPRTPRHLTWVIKSTSNFGSLGLPTTFPDY